MHLDGKPLVLGYYPDGTTEKFDIFPVYDEKEMNTRDLLEECKQEMHSPEQFSAILTWLAEKIDHTNDKDCTCWTYLSVKASRSVGLLEKITRLQEAQKLESGQ